MESIENNSEYQYCEACGRKLEFAQFVEQGYDTKTGNKRKDLLRFQCPFYTEKPHMYVFWPMSHTMVDIDPDEYLQFELIGL